MEAAIGGDVMVAIDFVVVFVFHVNYVVDSEYLSYLKMLEPTRLSTPHDLVSGEDWPVDCQLPLTLAYQLRRVMESFLRPGGLIIRALGWQPLTLSSVLSK